MRVKLRGKKLDFDPSGLEWRKQSSPDAQFAFWQSPVGDLFVKRFRRAPTGWDLILQSVKRPVPNTPKVLATAMEEEEHFLFAEKLQGDTFYDLLQENRSPVYFSKPMPGPEDRLKIFVSVYAIVRELNRRGFWYPDLDLKNVFIEKTLEGYRVCLIDLDSCAPHGQAYVPDHVSQTFWEGMVQTFHNRGKPFLSRENQAHPVIEVAGQALNQSMLILFAFHLQRLGYVPGHLPLYAPLVHPKNAHSEEVIRLNEKLAEENDCWNELPAFFSKFFKVSDEEFSRLTEENFPLPWNFFSWPNLGLFVKKLLSKYLPSKPR